ncbi:hypothetical protein [Brunnivagina elsteri]|uniref:Uncharacterized protein n=1 Tax=Brunnivagina elsteri CCALA 953 TaxID=987040 RepID=A0A2A2TJH4_9CYAN|nr:hypothetical protein [Calothrix elsteri]PAX54899.1 hypothetical protein CK510_11805 [Calothrix elsteri CCALA 953]
MPRNRIKPCYNCSQTPSLLYRVKYDKEGNWTFLCLECWQQISQNNPFYLYGGTWKAKKK